MKNILKSALVLLLGVSLAQCSEDYLDVSSPSNTDDDFVTSTPAETWKTLSWCYGNFRIANIAAGGNYNWEDIVSDVEYYPENGSANANIGRLHPELSTTESKATQFNETFKVLARAARVAAIIEGKSEYKAAVESGTTNDWTNLYGEAIAIRSYCYYLLCIHFGDVPYGIENKVVDEYSLTSRFDIYDAIIADLEKVQPLMYVVGEGGVTAERMNRTFVCGLIGKICMHAAGYQTLRSDVAGLYGDLQFDKIGSDANNCFYGRRKDYVDYLKKAETYFDIALGAAKGSVRFITTDDRAGIDNPYQRAYQYTYDLEISPESLCEIGFVRGVGNSELGYSQGRPSAGGSKNAAPCKVFAAIRIVPSAYYTLYEAGDKRADANMVVTGGDGNGNEAILTFKSGSKLDGGISINKWDVNRQNPPYVTSQRASGINHQVLHIADVMLLNAEAKAQIGKEAEARALLNQIRARAFGDDKHNVTASGADLLDAIWKERTLELLGEGEARWDMIRSGKFHERTSAMKNAMASLKADLKDKGYHDFGNGKTMPGFIWTKLVHLDQPLTYNAVAGDPALTPGWRGIYDYSTIEAVASKLKGDAHNLAIQGLDRYIDPNGTEAAALEADGYVKTSWGLPADEKGAEGLLGTSAINDDNFLGGWKNGEAPRYFHPIPFEVLNQSRGNVTNGYGLPQE